MSENGLEMLSQSSQEIADKIATSNEMSEVKDLTQLFNLNQAKRNVYRLLKLNGLLDKIDDAIVERINKNPNLFNNADLINYLNAVQNSIEKSTKLVGGVETAPLIQINNTEATNHQYQKYSSDVKRIMKLYNKQLLNCESSFKENIHNLHSPILII